jgi:hypothetical protein
MLDRHGGDSSCNGSASRLARTSMEQQEDAQDGGERPPAQPDGDAADVDSAVATLLALAESLDELELERVAPAFGPQRW